MGRFKVGDIVARKSYGLDILFKVIDIKKNDIEDDLTLKGITYRIEADAPESDLALQSEQRIREYVGSADREIEQKCSQMGRKSKSRLWN